MSEYLLFFFVAFGSKLLLALATIYLVLPAEPRCSECDDETLPILMSRPGRAISWLLRGRLQRRWCYRCGWEGWVRLAPDRARPGPALRKGSRIR